MTVSDSILREIMVFLSSMALGAALMILYDIIRIFRRILPRGIVWVSVEDILYWLFFGTSVFILLYRENDGAIRGFIVGGIALGLSLYYLLLGRRMMRRIGRSIRSIKKRLKKLRENVKIKLSKPQSRM